MAESLRWTAEGGRPYVVRADFEVSYCGLVLGLMVFVLAFAFVKGFSGTPPLRLPQSPKPGMANTCDERHSAAFGERAILSERRSNSLVLGGYFVGFEAGRFRNQTKQGGSQNRALAHFIQTARTRICAQPAVSPETCPECPEIVVADRTHMIKLGEKEAADRGLEILRNNIGSE